VVTSGACLTDQVIVGGKAHQWVLILVADLAWAMR
jgi:hypothetical protein